MVKVFVIGILYTIFNSLVTPVQAQSFVFRNYNSTDGLPSSETYCSIQDSEGYMWFGTDRGVAKFDGYSFKTYTNEEGMPDNTIFSLQEDNEKKLWFTSFSSTIGYLKNDSISLYPYNELIKSKHSSEVIVGMILDNNKKLWFTKSGCKQKYVLYNIDEFGKLDSLDSKTASDTKKIYINSKGTAIFSGNPSACYSEVYLLETGKKIAGFTHKISRDYAFARFDPNGKDFYLCANNQVLLFRDGVLKKLLECEGQIISFCADREKNFWVGYRDKGLEHYPAKNSYKEVITGLEGHTVSSITQDREGGMWFTTLEKGIYYLSPYSPLSLGEREGILYAKTSRVEKIGDGIVVISSNHSVFIKDKGEKKFITSIQKNISAIDVAFVPKENLLYLMALNKCTIPLKMKSIFIRGIKRMHIGKKYLWSVENNGAHKYEKSGKLVEEILLPNISRNTALMEMDNGDLLVGTLIGLYLYKNNIAYPLKKNNPLFGYRVSDIKELNKNILLVATIGMGIYLVDKKNYTILKSYTTTHGLPSTMCNMVLIENDSIVWVGTNKGLCRASYLTDFSKAGFVTINANDGLASNEINDICIIDNELWAATANGVSIVPRELWRKKILEIPLYINGVSVNGEMCDLNHTSSFSYNQNNINFSFVGINYQYAGKLQYKYRLAGGDRKWYYTTNRSVVYNSLAPGQYTFELTVIKPNGETNPITAYYSFVIRPPYWGTWWFFSFIACVATFCIYLFIYLRIGFVKKRVQLNNDLNRYRDKALREQMNPHFVYNSLNSIQNYILKNDVKSSASFLAKFSQLMRLVFTNTGQEFVTLDKDIDALKLYAELENLRFPNKFTLHVKTNLMADVSRIEIPPLLIQPFVENALLHGLLTKETPGNVWVDILTENGMLKISITDDGIGREAAARIKERKDKYKALSPILSRKRKTSGITATIDRINQAWGKNSSKSGFIIVDLRNKNNQAVGTTVSFCLPINYD